MSESTKYRYFNDTWKHFTDMYASVEMLALDDSKGIASEALSTLEKLDSISLPNRFLALFDIVYKDNRSEEAKTIRSEILWWIDSDPFVNKILDNLKIDDTSQ